MPSRLQSRAQLDWSQGMWRAVARHLIPERGAYALINALLDEDGSPYKRGGSAFLSDAAFGTKLTFLFDGLFAAGPRTVIANPADFGVLDAVEHPINLGGAGLAAPKRAVAVAGRLFIGGGHLYAGSRKTAGYNTGTVSITAGSKIVTGSGTAWLANVDAGMLIRVPGGSGWWSVVASVDSDTQITMQDAAEGTGAGQSYDTLPLVTPLDVPYRVSDFYAVAANRLFALEGRRAYFSEPGRPHDFKPDENFHETTQDLLGGAGLADRALLFATNGMWVASNLHFDLTDVDGNQQQNMALVDGDKILWSHEGIAAYANALIVPCADHVWILDGISAPVPLTASIAGLYRAYVKAGYRTGIGAVYRSHYFLPILDSSNTVHDLLVCRLDRPFRSAVGVAYPWTQLADFSRDLTALAVRTGGPSTSRRPRLLGASQRDSSRVLDMTPIFGPDVTYGKEPDDTVHTFDLVFRDWATGDGQTENTVRAMIPRYEMFDDEPSPTLTGFWSDGSPDTADSSLWGEMVWGVDTWGGSTEQEWTQLAGQAPPDDGREPYYWSIGKKVRFFRGRLRNQSATKRLVLRSLELRIRPTNKR